MREEERQEARRILLLLLTVADDPGKSLTGGARARCTAEDLVGAGGTPAQAALEALVRGRLVAAGETYEIAHEALARVWPRLRAWRDEASEGRAVAARSRPPRASGSRLGRGKEGLGSERLLRELDGAPGALDGASDERVALVSAFAAASRAALKRAHVRRWALAVGIPFLLASLGGTEWVVSSARHRAMVARAVADARSLDTKSRA